MICLVWVCVMSVCVLCVRVFACEFLCGVWLECVFWGCLCVCVWFVFFRNVFVCLFVNDCATLCELLVFVCLCVFVRACLCYICVCVLFVIHCVMLYGCCLICL